MVLLTTDKLPNNKKIDFLFTMTQYTGMVEVSSKGIIRKRLEKDKNEYQEVLNSFINTAPTEANVIMNVRVSTTTQEYTNGTFMYLTYIGTPATNSDI
jgi:regulator of nucleoside diphosphate kinase